MKKRLIPLLLAVFTVCMCGAAAGTPPETATIARHWNEEILAAIRIDLPNPAVHARNLFHLSVVMYDAWAAYDPVAVGYLYHAKHQASNTQAARYETISYAAYRILSERYALSYSSKITLARLSEKMEYLGYSTNDSSLDADTPAGLGNRIAANVSTYFMQDGALQERGYKDFGIAAGGYAAINPPLLTLGKGTLIVDANRWQPLAITNAISQNDIPVEIIQRFVGSQWKGVRPFALERAHSDLPWIDPGPPPRLGDASDAQFRAEVLEVIRCSSELTTADSITIDASPGALGNNTLGTNDRSGHPVNPFTDRPYALNLVKRGDFARVLAEFWADGPQSETPPGHWNTLANYVTDQLPARRIGGSGPVLDALEWEVKLYFALNAALHDAACAAWSLKRHYDGWRPISAIRAMGQLGQSSSQDLPSYHEMGLPLVAGLVELVTVESSQPGARHAGLPTNEVAVLSWAGEPGNPDTETGGVRWKLAADWIPYQKKTFVTPAFPGYISGHSTFSRAAAEVLTAITGSAFFPGGLGTFTAGADRFLTFERGPSEDVELQWATYYDAADQAGLSRIWGGIHVSADDLTGRRIGAACGQRAWNLARRYFDAAITQEPVSLSITRLTNDRLELQCDTVRGFTYQLQSAPSLAEPFTDIPSAAMQAVDTATLSYDLPSGPMRLFRVVRKD